MSDPSNPLSEFDICQEIQNDELLKHHFRGIFNTSDVEHINLREGEFAILYWPPKVDNIGHWTAIFLNKGLYEYFDSFGETFINKKHILNKLTKKYSVLSSKIKFQCSETNSCGKFVLYFIYNRILHLLENYFIFLAKLFSINCEINEKIVESFFNYINNGSNKESAFN